jgi:hypothetical protein
LFEEILAFRELDEHIVCRRVGKKRVSELADFVLVGKESKRTILVIKFVQPIREDWGFWNDIRTMYPLIRYSRLKSCEYVAMCDFRDVIAIQRNFQEDFTYLGETLTLQEIKTLQKKPQDFEAILYRVVWHYVTVAKKIGSRHSVFCLPAHTALPHKLSVTSKSLITTPAQQMANRY